MSEPARPATMTEEKPLALQKAEAAYEQLGQAIELMRAYFAGESSDDR